MRPPNVCLGCFQEWSKEWKICPVCGWEQGEKPQTSDGWAAGDVFEQRYLLGRIFCQTPGAAVWRVYDHLLGLACFLLCLTGGNTEDLYLAATRIEKLETLTGCPVQLLALKRVGGREVLLFSMRDAQKAKDAMQTVLQAKSRKTNLSSEQPETESDMEGEEQALPPGTLLQGRYRILRCIGIGGFGITYLCRDFALHRMAAVKEYFPFEWAMRDGQYVDVKESRMLEAYRFGMQSFYKEAKMQAKFIHTPHIAAIYDICEANDTIYLVMEYIAGISIGREMRQRNYRPYAAGEVWQIILPVLDALHAIHEERLIHSDVSPGNIMRSEDGEIYLIDLGAAKYALDSLPSLSAAFLKPDYAAPEQYRTAREGIPKDEGAWTDVYAVGATMYYLLTGQKPPDVMQRLSAKKQDLKLPGKLRRKQARQWEKFLSHAMSLDIHERMHSVEQLREEGRKLIE